MGNMYLEGFVFHPFEESRIFSNVEFGDYTRGISPLFKHFCKRDFAPDPTVGLTVPLPPRCELLLWAWYNTTHRCQYKYQYP